MGAGGFYFQDFEKAWEAYPKKTAMGLARHAWNRLRQSGELPPLPEVLAAINRFTLTDAWKRENGRYIPQFSNFLTGQRWLDPLSAEEEAAKRSRLEAEQHALARKQEEDAAQTRSNEKRQRLRPVYDAFAARFGEEARQENERRDAMLFGTWMHHYGKYAGPTAADVPADMSGSAAPDILDFLKAYQRRRDAEAYQAAQRASVPTRDPHADNRENKPVMYADILHSGNVMARYISVAQGLRMAV